MTVQEEHSQRIGRAFMQRQHAQKKLTETTKRLQQAGEWMAAVGGCLRSLSAWDIQEENGVLALYRLQTRSHDTLNTIPVPLPTQEEIVSLFQAAK